MYFIRVLEKAERDLKGISRYIAQDNPYKAVSFVQEMLISFKNKVSLYPRSGMECKDFYYSIYKSYFIFYDILEDKKEIAVLHIIHASQYTAYKHFL